MKNCLNNNIGISGVTGFIGQNLKQFLNQKDYKVFGISRNSSVESDIKSYKEFDECSFNQIKAFIHLAGKAHDLKKTSSVDEYFTSNTELTKSLFDKWLKSDCEIFIFMSSVKAVADKADFELKEDINATPLTAYGKSKLAAENYILSKDIPDSKRVYILRPCMIHGPGNKGNLNLLFNLVKKGVPYPLGSYENKRSFLSVDNLCYIIDKLIGKKPLSGIYNIADDMALSTKELLIIIGKTLNKEAKIVNLPKFLVSVIAKIGDISTFPLNSERLRKLTDNYLVSNIKIKNALKDELPLSSEEGLKKTIKSFII